MVKNHANVLPLKDSKLKVYIPKRHFPSVVDFFGNATKDYWDYPVNLDVVKKYYTVVNDPPSSTTLPRPTSPSASSRVR